MLTALRSNRFLVFGLLAGVLLRGAVLINEGTPDVATWKTWSYASLEDPVGLYGVGGVPPERRVLRWGDITGTTEYPPLGLAALAVVGRAYRAIDPTFTDSTRLTVFIKAPGLFAEVLLVVFLLTIGRRMLGNNASKWMALAIWLNPAVILNGAALGYLDAQMAIPAVGAFIAISAGWPLLAGVLAAATVLTKLQGVFVGAALVLALVRQSHMPVWRAVARFTTGGVALASAVLLPIVVHGAWPNMVQALGRVAYHDILSAYAANAWWVVTWVVRASHGAPVVGWYEAVTALVRILSIQRFVAVGYPDPQVWAASLVVGLILLGVWRFRNATTLADWAYVGGLSVFSYFVWNVQVHENHLYGAVPLLALAGALDARYRPSFWAVSIACALNMYLFYGVGDGHRLLISRRVTGVDLSVFLSIGVVALWAYMVCRPVRRVGGHGL